MDNAESPRGQPAKSGTTWQPRRSILVSSHGREREDKLGFEGEKREGKESRKGERRRIWVECGERRAAGQPPQRDSLHVVLEFVMERANHPPASVSE